jgi:CBS domain-containing protein
MKINEIMTCGVEVIQPEATVQEAAQKLKEFEIGSVPVCDGERLVGMITDRDIAIRLAAEGKDPATVAVKRIMTPDVLWCFEDQTVEEAGRMMKENHVRRLPVISHDRRLVGILTLGDMAVRTNALRAVGQTLQEISEAAPA